MLCVSRIITLYLLNLYSAVFTLYLNKTGGWGEKKKEFHKQLQRLSQHSMDERCLTVK